MTATVGGRLTRITVSGAVRRADLVLPSDDPVGLLVPDLVALVGAATVEGPGAYQLSTPDGTVLDSGVSLHDAGVPDGTVIRLDTVAEAPPVPILHDVTDHVSDDADSRRGRWDATALRWTATAVAVAGGVTAALLVSAAARLTLIPAGAVLLIAGAAVAAGGRGSTGQAGTRAAAGDEPRRVATPVSAGLPNAGDGSVPDRLQAVGVALALVGAAVAFVGCAFSGTGPSGRLALAVSVTAAVVALVGAATGHRRAALLGAGMLIGHLVLWWTLRLAALPLARVAAVVAVVVIGLLGVLPRVAITVSGLAALDDRQAADEPVTRLAAHAAVNAAHRGLALATMATAVSGALAGWLLAGADDGWARALAGVLAVVLLLRLRAFPLTVEVVAVVAAAAGTLVGLLRLWVRLDPGHWWAVAAAALAGSAVALLVLAYRPRPHVRARARQLGDRLEALAVVASVPVAVGVFGLYERLLATF